MTKNNDLPPRIALFVSLGTIRGILVAAAGHVGDGAAYIDRLVWYAEHRQNRELSMGLNKLARIATRRGAGILLQSVMRAQVAHRRARAF